jgi:nitrogen fixation/metabolism regulation signal transduction histidine kinase
MTENNSEKKTTDQEYDIAFIDPNEIIEFIQDHSEDDVDLNDPTEEEVDDPLLYTTQIIEDSKEYVTKRQEDTRGKLAIIYTLCTFGIFLLMITVAVLDGVLRKVSIIENLTTLIPLISGVFLGSLGFVLGYYFKKEDTE